MKSKLMLRVSVLVGSAVIAFATLAQEVKQADLPFNLGDSISTVRTATNGDIETQKDGVVFIHLEDQGIWIFFNQQKVANSIRFNAPYSGYVAGIKVGDSEKSLQVVMGNPIKAPWEFGNNTAFLYRLNADTNVRFDVNTTTGRVKTIFLMNNR
jgi:opacity protein-like surface antigen